jgi:hypothetical protein
VLEILVSILQAQSQQIAREILNCGRSFRSVQSMILKSSAMSPATISAPRKVRCRRNLPQPATIFGKVRVRT